MSDYIWVLCEDCVKKQETNPHVTHLLLNPGWNWTSIILPCQDSSLLPSGFEHPSFIFIAVVIVAFLSGLGETGSLWLLGATWHPGEVLPFSQLVFWFVQVADALILSKPSKQWVRFFLYLRHLYLYIYTAALTLQVQTNTNWFEQPFSKFCTAENIITSFSRYVNKDFYRCLLVNCSHMDT